MFERIIVPLDGTPFAEAALAPARELADTFGSRLVLVRALPPAGRDGGPGESTRQVELERLNDADAYLHEIAASLRTHGYGADLLLYGAAPDAGIARAAELSAADLIVMSGHTRWTGRLADAASTTLGLLDRAPTPILVWHKGEKQWAELLQAQEPCSLLARCDAPILVPLDGTPFAEKVLPAAEGLARAFGSRLVLVRAVAPATSQAATVTERATAYGEIADRATVEYLTRLDRAGEYLERVRATISRDGVSAEAIVRTGESFAVIEAAWREQRPNLIVMASHSREWYLGRLLDSLAVRVIEEVDAPVLVIRPDGAGRPVRTRERAAQEGRHSVAAGG